VSNSGQVQVSVINPLRFGRVGKSDRGQGLGWGGWELPAV